MPGDTWTRLARISGLSLEDGPFALDVGDDLLVEDTTFAAHLLGEGLGRLPARRGARSCLFHHLVNLFQSKTLGLGDEEPGIDEGAGTKATPDEEHRRLEVAPVFVDHVGGNDGDDSVPEPVGGSAETHTAGTDREGEDLADNDPGTRSPGRRKEEDEDGNE